MKRSDALWRFACGDVLKALPFSDSLTKYVIKSNLVLAYCSHTCICICICICCTCIFERLRDLVVPCWADWQVTVLSHLHPLSRPPIMADRDCFDHQNTRQLEGGPTCQFQSQIVATVIFKTMTIFVTKMQESAKFNIFWKSQFLLFLSYLR